MKKMSYLCKTFLKKFKKINQNKNVKKKNKGLDK